MKSLELGAYLYKNEYEASAEAYQKATEYLRELELDQTYIIYGYIYAGMGKLYLEKGSLKKAKEYFDKAEEVVLLNNKSTDLKIFYNTYLKSYYAETENWIDFRATVDSIKQLEQEVLGEKNAMLINLFGEVRKESDSNLFRTRVYKSIAISTSGILLLSFVFIRKRRKRYEEHVNSILKQVESHNMVDIKKEVPSKLTTEKQKASTEHISAETLKRIKDRLIVFEQHELFLDPKVDATALASYCETNVRYISDVISTHKGENVSSYINRLRVTYLLKKLKNDKKYRNYKISYLAKEAGFSSHSKFSTEFKQIVGLSPSVFIARMPR